MYEALGDTYSPESKLECLVYDVHALEAVGHCDVSSDALAVCACAGFSFTGLSRMGRISIAGGNGEGESASLPKQVETMDKDMIHLVEVGVCAVEFFESEELKFCRHSVGTAALLLLPLHKRGFRKRVCTSLARM